MAMLDHSKIGIYPKDNHCFMEVSGEVKKWRMECLKKNSTVLANILSKLGRLRIHFPQLDFHI